MTSSPRSLVVLAALFAAACSGGPAPTPTPTPDPAPTPAPDPSPPPTATWTASITSAPAGTTLERFASFTFSAASSDAGAGSPRFQCQVDGGSYADCSSPFTWMPTAVDAGPGTGAHSFAVRAGDGTSWGTPAQATWTIEDPIDAALAADALASSIIATTTSAVPPDYTGSTPETDQTPYLKGIARFQCLESHVAYDDPLVFPGLPGAAHLHSFWGNTGSDAASTATSLFTSGDSTCQGRTLNRTGYWVPVLLAPSRTGNLQTGWQVVPKDADDKAIAAGLFHETYYYSAVVTDVSSIQAPPVGLRMIAGTSSATAAAPANARALDDDHYVAHWYCAVRGSNPGRQTVYSGTVPACGHTQDAQGRDNSLVHFVIRFPSCWNGVDLDAPDHQSHMAYPVFGTTASGQVDHGRVVCPADHPVPIPEVSYHYSFTVSADNVDPVTRTSRGWRLASDGYVVGTASDGSDVAGGASLHGDWFNAWNPVVLQAFIDGCLKARKDCSGGELGAPRGDGVNLVLGDVVRVTAPTYPALPFPDDLAGMPPATAMATSSSAATVCGTRRASATGSR